MKVAILVNTLTAVSSAVYHNHMHFMRKTTKLDPTIELVLITPPRMAIDAARNYAAKVALAHECDYLMFLDDDVLIPADGLIKMLETKADMVCGVVIIRGYPFNVMAWRALVDQNDEKKLQIEYFNDLPLDEKGEPLERITGKEHGLFGFGFSCALISCEILKALPPPWFVTGVGSTEDFYFCDRVYHELEDISIVMRGDVRCGHLMQAEPIEWGNRDQMTALYKPIAEAIERQNERPLRYIEEMKEALEKADAKV